MTTLILVFIFWSQNVFSRAEEASIDIVTKYLELGIEPKTVTPCSHISLEKRMSFVGSEKCNEDLKDNYRSTQRLSIYSLFQSDRPFNQCTENISMSEEEIINAKKALTESAERDGLYQHFAFQCQEKIGTDDDDYNFHSVMVQAGHNLRQKKLEAVALQSMRGLNNLDNILGREMIEKEISCNDNITSKVEKACQDFKACPQRRGRVFFQANMTLEALKTMDELDHMIEETVKKMEQNSRSLRRGTSYRIRAREQNEKLGILVEDLRQNREDIASTVPWIKGKEFKNDLKRFKERMDKLRNEEGDISETSAKRSLVTDIGSSMIKQFKADRKELLKRYDDANQAIICLDNKKECSNFDEIINMSPPIDVSEFEDSDKPAMVNAYKLIKANQCIDQKAQSVRNYRDTTIDIASIGAGFLMGGVGGFVRLASVAGKMYLRGNRIRGLASAALLGLESAAIVNQGKDAIQSCSMVRRNLANFEKAETSVSCEGNDNQMTAMTNYTECLKDIAFLSVGAIAGVAPDIAKSFKRTNISLRRRPDNIKRIDEIFEQAKVPTHARERMKDQLLRLGIKDSEKEEFIKLFKKLDNLDDDEMLDHAETTMVFFNQLSAKRKKLFLDNFPDTIDGLKNKAGGLGFRLSRIKNQYAKAVTKMDGLQNSAAKQHYRKLLKKGVDKETAARESAEHGRKVRRQTQEREFGCRANKMTEQHRKGAALFTNFTVGFGMASTAGAFTLANSDRPKDFDFAKDLTYELSMAFIMSKIGARIQAKPSNTLLGRYTKSNIYSSGLGVIDSAVFANVYDISQDEIEDQVQRIQNNPAQMEALAKYEKYFKEENIMERIEQSVLKQFEHSLEQPETQHYFNQTEVEIGGKKFSGPINTASLQDPKLKEEIVDAIMLEFYEDAKGVYGTGSLFGDKYLYDRGYNALFGIPRAMTAGYLTYTTLCRNADNPVKGIVNAFVIQGINQAIGGYLYYDYRKDFVGR